jgi:uncharacterized protein
MDGFIDLEYQLDLKYSVRDPIHGFIRFNEWEKTIINHPWFQRLRHIRQLAFTDYVYPGATHSRFEHSLGVMHLATRMFRRIVCKCKSDLQQVIQPYTAEDDYWKDVVRTAQVLRFAALLHDTGHGPFSHAAESVYPKKDGSDKRYKHEDYSIAVIKNLRELIDDSIYNAQYTDFIGGSITADEVASVLEEKVDTKNVSSKFWTLIRAITSSQLDADRLDYLLRDSHYVGAFYGRFDLERTIESLTFCIDCIDNDAVDERSFEIALAIESDDSDVAESIITARERMFSQVYRHKTRRIFDLMLADAILTLLKNNDLNEFPPPSQIVEYLSWTDVEVFHSLSTLGDDQNPILVKALTRREFPRLVGKFSSEPNLQIFEDKVKHDTSYTITSDKELNNGKTVDNANVWIDRGLSFTTYKTDGRVQVKLRDSKPSSAGGVSNALRFAPSDLSNKNIQLLMKDTLKKPEYRVYSTEDKRREVAELVKECEGEPWNG